MNPVGTAIFILIVLMGLPTWNLHAQGREDQILLIFGDIPRCQVGEGAIEGPCPTNLPDLRPWAIEIDPMRYPAGASFRLDIGLTVAPGATECAVLFNLTDSAVVIGSDVCVSNQGSADLLPVRVRSSSFSLAPGAREYVARFTIAAGGSSGGVQSVRLIVTWLGR